MKCPEARNLISAHLDSELDAKTSIEVEEHLKACTECAELFTAEAKFNQRLAGSLNVGRRTNAVWEAAEAGIHGEHRAVSFRRVWPLALAVSLALVASVTALWWFKSRPLDLAVAVEECHQAYARKFTSPEFTGAVPDDIARKLGLRLDVAAFAYHPVSEAFNEHGARYCHVGDVPVAVILGHYQDVPVSLFVIKRSELEHFPRTQRRLESGDPIVCGGAGRYQFAARFVDGHVVCIMGETGRPSLEALLKTVVRKG